MDLSFKNIISGFNETFTFFCVFPAIIIFGIYLTFKLKFVQFSKLKMSFSCLMKKEEKGKGNISNYQAISAVVAGNLGTGNISGMAVAISAGGPGALVWMWVMSFLGAVIQYASCTLGMKYRKVNSEGEYVGGPMYYISEGLGFKKLGIFFSFCAILAAFTVGNFAQINSVALPFQKIGISPLLCGIGMAIVVGAVILGGIQRVAKVASSVVPVMATLYLGAALVIIFMHVDKVGGALWMMLTSAFDCTSITGGVLGYAIVKSISTGFDRGLFATDAGTGIVPILQASARTENPVLNGIATLIAPFLVMVLCTATGVVLIVTGAWQHLDLQSTNMVTYAFQEGLGSRTGIYFVIFALALFSYTTIIAWACCAEKAVGFLWGTKHVRKFQYLYIALIPVGAITHVDIVWALADISISLMLVTNLIGVAGLSKQVIGESREFFSLQASNHG
ncbi:MAG TPA: amino acid carrier protein [Rhabdochlamydiaceae bacterium]|nr:amino acid carrier protein [Rhabdochlamydiaceae bacterium]